MEKYISAPLKDETSRELKSGDYVYISGTISVSYTHLDVYKRQLLLRKAVLI